MTLMKSKEGNENRRIKFRAIMVGSMPCRKEDGEKGES